MLYKSKQRRFFKKGEWCVLRVYAPQYSLDEVLEFKAKEEHHQLYWFIALTLFYIDKNLKLRLETKT